MFIIVGLLWIPLRLRLACFYLIIKSHVRVTWIKVFTRRQPNSLNNIVKSNRKPKPASCRVYWLHHKHVLSALYVWSYEITVMEDQSTYLARQKWGWISKWCPSFQRIQTAGFTQCSTQEVHQKATYFCVTPVTVHLCRCRLQERCVAPITRADNLICGMTTVQKTCYLFTWVVRGVVWASTRDRRKQQAVYQSPGRQSFTRSLLLQSCLELGSAQPSRVHLALSSVVELINLNTITGFIPPVRKAKRRSPNCTFSWPAVTHAGI